MIQQLSNPALEPVMDQIEELTSLAPKLSAKDRAFAESLLKQHAKRGNLTSKQWPWVGKLIDLARTPTAVIASQKAVGAFDAFARATPAGKVFPKVLIADDDFTLSIAPASVHGKNAGSLSLYFAEGVTKAKGVWCGLLRSDDTVNVRGSVGTKNATKIVSVLEAFGADMIGVLAATGKSLGCCAKCGRTLTDPRSVAFGIGPVCAGYLGVHDQWLVAADGGRS